MPTISPLRTSSSMSFGEQPNGSGLCQDNPAHTQEDITDRHLRIIGNQLGGFTDHQSRQLLIRHSAGTQCPATRPPRNTVAL